MNYSIRAEEPSGRELLDTRIIINHRRSPDVFLGFTENGKMGFAISRAAELLRVGNES